MSKKLITVLILDRHKIVYPIYSRKFTSRRVSASQPSWLLTVWKASAGQFKKRVFTSVDG
jgi:hypothetical protein